MNRIKLTQGKFALVDAADFQELSKHKWCAENHKHTLYAARNISTSKGRRILRMHVAILGKRPGMEIDHINRNGLDNRRANLRFVTRQENCRNLTKRKNCSSEYIGVSFFGRTKKWRSQICLDGKRIHLGYFDKETEALDARRRAEKTLWKK